MLIGMDGLTFHQRLGKHVSRSRLQLGRDLTFDRLELGIQIEAEVAEPPFDHEALMLARGAEYDFGRPQRRVAANEVIRDGGALDPGASSPEPIGKETQISRDGAPASRH
jgi:hypothetical protein